MSTYVIFHPSPDALLTQQASTLAKGLGLKVHSARSGAILVTGHSATVKAAAKKMPGGDWEVVPQRSATTIPEKKEQPHRRLRGTASKKSSA